MLSHLGMTAFFLSSFLSLPIIFPLTRRARGASGGEVTLSQLILFSFREPYIYLGDTLNLPLIQSRMMNSKMTSRRQVFIHPWLRDDAS